MSKNELEKRMRAVLIKIGKPETEIETVVKYMINLPYLQTDESRLSFYNEWKDRYENE